MSLLYIPIVVLIICVIAYRYIKLDNVFKKKHPELWILSKEKNLSEESIVTLNAMYHKRIASNIAIRISFDDLTVEEKNDLKKQYEWHIRESYRLRNKI